MKKKTGHLGREQITFFREMLKQDLLASEEFLKRQIRKRSIDRKKNTSISMILRGENYGDIPVIRPRQRPNEIFTTPRT